MRGESAANGVATLTARRPLTFKTLVRYGRARLEAAGVSETVTSARKLVCHALDWDLPQAIRRADDAASDTVLDELKRLLERRVAREPLQYIIGEAPFYNQTFLCDARALVPRPETEILVHEALTLAEFRGLERPRVVDVGCGGGAIALAFKSALPNAAVFATDVSEDALALARANAERLNAEVHFARGDLFADLTGLFDIVLSNPPYIKSAALARLQPEIAYEPTAALDGGEDGLRVIEPLLNQLPRFLNPQGGLALIEIDPPISAAAARIATDLFPEAKVEIQKDFNRLDRILRIAAR